jgi:dTDP-4-dehydrorhamnose reductase
MRLLVTGGGGMLGQAVAAVATRLGHEVVALSRTELDITDADHVRRVVTAAEPRAIVNCAAWTDVDGAETAEAAATAVNGAGPGNLARAVAESGARLVHVSTDYVFDGEATEPYPVDAPVAPRSAYGRTKAAGERAVAAAGGDATVVRTAWVYGAHGGNFVRTMAGRALDGAPVSVVDDQVGSPTWAADLATGLVALGARPGPVPPVLHRTDAGAVSWYGLARAVYEEVGADPALVTPTTTEAFPRPAPRPAWSVLDGSAWLAAGLPAPRPWRTALHLALQEWPPR